MTCPHGMPKPTTCVDCFADGPVAPPVRWQQVGNPFAAHFAGTCGRCGTETPVGSRIVREDLGDERTRYVHETRCPS